MARVHVYVGLFLAIWSGDWVLPLACIKLMAPAFSAFDHLAYRKLIAQHLADVMSLPQSILECVQMGGFVVTRSGHAWHSVATDTQYENKQGM